MSEPETAPPTAISRVERVLNVLALLLDTARPISRDEILGEVSGYPAGEVAARRAFERDKETLRAMGVPISMTVLADGVDVGYRVLPAEYYLPDLGLDPDESAALRMAVNAVALLPQGAVVPERRAGHGALLKLGGLAASGSPPPIAALPMAPALAPLFDAQRRRARASFEYRGTNRTVEPWSLQSQHGHWYVVGRDLDRDALRTFRVDRIEGDVTTSAPDAFVVPDDFDTSDHLVDAPWDIGEGERFTARVAFSRPHDLGALERLGPDAVAEAAPDGRVVITFEANNAAALRTFVLGFMEHAEVLEPAELRNELITWLRAVAR